MTRRGTGLSSSEWHSSTVKFELSSDHWALWPVPHSTIVQFNSIPTQKFYEQFRLAMCNEREKNRGSPNFPTLSNWADALNAAKDHSPLPHQHPGQSQEDMNKSSLWAIVAIFYHAKELAMELSLLNTTAQDLRDAFDDIFIFRGVKSKPFLKFIADRDLNVTKKHESSSPSLALAKRILKHNGKRDLTADTESKFLRLKAALMIYDGSLQLSKSGEFFVRVMYVECFTGSKITYAPMEFIYYPSHRKYGPSLTLRPLPYYLFSPRQRAGIDHFECSPFPPKDKVELDRLRERLEQKIDTPACSTQNTAHPTSSPGPLAGIFSVALEAALIDTFEDIVSRSTSTPLEQKWYKFLPPEIYNKLKEVVSKISSRTLALSSVTVQRWAANSSKEAVASLQTISATSLPLIQQWSPELLAACASLISWNWVQFQSNVEKISLLPVLCTIPRITSLSIPFSDMLIVLRRSIALRARSICDSNQPDDVLACWASYVSRNLLRKNDAHGRSKKTWIDRTTRDLINALKHRPKINESHHSLYYNLVAHLQHLLLMATSLAYNLKGLLLPQEEEILVQVTRLWTMQTRWMYRLLKVLPSFRYSEDEWVIRPVWTCCYGEYDWMPVDSTRIMWTVTSTDCSYCISPDDFAQHPVTTTPAGSFFELHHRHLVGCRLEEVKLVNCVLDFAYSNELESCVLRKCTLENCQVSYCVLDDCKCDSKSVVQKCLVRDNNGNPTTDIRTEKELYDAKGKHLGIQNLKNVQEELDDFVKATKCWIQQGDAGSEAETPLLDACKKAIKQIVDAIGGDWNQSGQNALETIEGLITPTLANSGHIAKKMSDEASTITQRLSKRSNVIATHANKQSPQIQSMLSKKKEQTEQPKVNQRSQVKKEKQVVKHQQRELLWITKWTVDFFEAKGALF